MSNIYKEASKAGLRFSTSKGNLGTDDLWNLGLTDLDILAKSLAKEIKESENGSYIKKARVTPKEKLAQLAFDIVIDIMDTKQEDAEAKSNDKVKSDQKKKLLSLLAEKKDQELKDKTPEEIQKMIEELD